MNTQMLGKCLETELRTRILAALQLDQAPLSGLILCGSRATNKARLDSDIDAIALIGAERWSDYRADYVGTISTDAGLLPAEIKILGHRALAMMVKEDPLYQVGSIARGIVMLKADPSIGLAQEAARVRMAAALDAFKREIQAQDFELQLRLMQNAYSQAPGILSCGNTTARICRFSELLLDFYVQVQILRLSSAPMLLDSTSAEALEELLHARGDRGARFLDVTRIGIPSWFKDLSSQLEHIWNDEGLDIDQRVSRSLNEMHEAFHEITGSPLIFSINTLPDIVAEVAL